MSTKKKNYAKPTPRPKRNATKKNSNSKFTFTDVDYNSGDGMLTTVWGPAMWHFLHTMSFNYPVHPTKADKLNYLNFIYNLRYVLPCIYCRINLTNNLKRHPLKTCHMQSRESFSKFIYNLHEIINKRLGKTSNLSYCDVRERYEHFRSRCTQNSPPPTIFNFKSPPKNKEKGCTEPLYGEKAKCVLSIVPQTKHVNSFNVDQKCIKYKL